jgi:leucyl aminopeptidase
VPDDVDALGVLVSADGAVPERIGVGRTALAAAGFDGTAGRTLLLPAADGPLVVPVGTGDGALDTAALRDAAAAFATAAAAQTSLALDLTGVTDVSGVDAEAVGQAATEGVLLAPYCYRLRKTGPRASDVAELVLVAADDRRAAVAAGAERGRVTASAANLARDLANTPPAHLTATRMAEVAIEIGHKSGLEVEVADRARLVELGCGRLLGVNRGSAE